MDTKPNKIIPSMKPKSLVHYGLNHQLNSSSNNINHIIYLVLYCTLDLFQTIIDEFIYYQSVFPKSLSFKSYNDIFTISQNGRYINTGYQLIDIVTDKVINIHTNKYHIKTHIKHNGEIMFNISCSSGPNKSQNTQNDDYSVIHSCNIKNLTQKLFNNILQTSMKIIQK